MSEKLTAEDWKAKPAFEFLDVPQNQLPLSLIASMNNLKTGGWLNSMDGFVEVVEAWQRAGANSIIGEREMRK